MTFPQLRRADLPVRREGVSRRAPQTAGPLVSGMWSPIQIRLPYAGQADLLRSGLLQEIGPGGEMNRYTTTGRAMAGLGGAFALTLAFTSTASAYYISPYFYGYSGAYYFPNPGCYTAGDLSGTNAAYADEVSGTCVQNIGVRVENASGGHIGIVWDNDLATSVVPSGTSWRYKIYHRDSSGN